MMIGLGRYNLLLKLGQGGMGAVFLARQKTLRRFCAVKVISPQFSQDQAAADRFLREARATASLNHQHLVNVFDCDQYDGQYFIAMEYIEGMSLGQIIRKHGGLPLPLALHWLKQAAMGLDYVHGKSIIHRDIKPDNLIIDTSGLLKVMDLGLAKDHLEIDQGMTMTGMVLGSPQYMSPEQINDSKTVDRRTDIYSLGISFYQMVVGRVPFQQTTSAAVCVAHLQQPMPSVNLPDAEIAKALDQLIGKMTAKEKEHRFQSAGELSAALTPWLATYPLDAASIDFFLEQLGFASRKVQALLEKEGLDPSQVDANLETPLPELGPTVGVNAGSVAALPGQGVAPPIPTPAASPVSPLPPVATPPVPAAPAKSFSKRWVAVAAVVPLLVLAAFFIGKAKQHRLVPEERIAQRKIEKESSTAQPLLGNLLVRTTPEANVLLHDLSKKAPMISKKSPAIFEKVPFGKYRVQVVQNGYYESEEALEVKSADFKEMDIVLTKLPGKATIVSDPPGAEVFIDGQMKGRTPYDIEGKDDEIINCTLRLAGFQDRQLTATLKSEGKVEKVKLESTEPAALHTNESDGTGPRKRMAAMMMGGDVPPEFQELNETLEQIRGMHALDWERAKPGYLATAKEKLKEKGVTDHKILEASANEISKIWEEVRGASEEEFQEQRTRYIREILGVFMRAKTGQMMPGKKMGGRPGLQPRRGGTEMPPDEAPQ
jgi:serine/threonine protein kinase